MQTCHIRILELDRNTRSQGQGQCENTGSQCQGHDDDANEH